jgi:hypothetical protein
MNRQKLKQNKEAFCRTCILLQYCQLPDKNSHDISQAFGIFNNIKIIIYTFHDFFKNPWWNVKLRGVSPEHLERKYGVYIEELL